MNGRMLLSFPLTMMLSVSWAYGENALLTATYDPLATPNEVAKAPLDFVVKDAARKRDIPILVYLPTAKTGTAVVLFSHGLGGTRKGCSYLGKHWAARGYVAVFLQHPGSDDSVWKEQHPGKRMAAMEAAASGQNFMLRVRDVPAVLNQLEVWHKSADHPLSGRLDFSRVGMSGHSFGAVTTQAVSGQSFAGRALLTDTRIRAAIAFSPSSPRRGKPATAFGNVKIPWMLMTGTKDVSVIGHTDLASRLAVYPALKAEKYELVLHDGQHSAFSDRALPGETGKRNPNHHRVILALSTAFWDTYLLQSEPARKWLQGPGPRSVLEEKDRWQLSVSSRKTQQGSATVKPGGK